MAQIGLERTGFRAYQTISPAQASAVQKMAFTGYLLVGDTVDVADMDAQGNITSWLAQGLTIVEIDPGVSVVLSSSVDTTTATGTPKLFVRSIDDGNAAIDRLYRQLSPESFTLVQNVNGQALNTPISGEATYYVNDIRFWAAGDTVALASNSGQASTGTVVSVAANANDTNNQSSIVVSFSTDTSALVSPYLVNQSITKTQVLNRLQNELAGIRAPVEAEFIGTGNGSQTAFFAQNLFEVNTAKLLVDGVRLRRGAAGTRASLTQGTSNAQVIATSLILGNAGNLSKLAVVAGAGTTVAVTGNWTTGYTVSVNDNAGAATAAQIATAINGDATASKIMQAQYGGTGAGAVIPFAATALAGGLDSNGSGDYAELEQVLANQISGTGYKILALRIPTTNVSDLPTRLHQPPLGDEEIVVDYRTLLYTK